ncbi:PSD1 and planctomycete cytochrome C domain-containing protein [Paraglaciecola aquimarina]|uniref:PSD1 and planctomycete cytochrome C domain-containing protein n=1 Tax=Paraglaciecola algarum TaxID=3050085 RepID=A0ABS9D4R6_9ALTE|nr:PSD1 and planctomycete cytochrome C domain-containing protein [Paraglaciecola sp. G1-23]MCF2947871.1 PSD1 and planctomycete cytochrome C domain-containing protein [Paraglaciecola sp. G1-23]
MKAFKVAVMLALAGLSVVAYQSVNTQADPDQVITISFNKDIRPILNENCTGCHGGVGKQSGVSFIYREEALGRGHSGRLTVVPGDPDASGLIERIESKDPNIRMPYKAPPLKPEQIALLRQWIEEGAEWEEHWAFEKPTAQAIPQSIDESKVNNEIDLFIQQSLHEQRLTPADKAEKGVLLRRLSLDLTGLPPTLDELNAFLNDESPEAYNKQVDRLLASKHFGERWASMWLDLARYADTKGYTWDKYRDTWPYRDWVIDAFNQNKPYNDFVIEQLAGDLLPNRTVDNMIATAFHRQTTSNDEGGTDDEEFRTVSILDRVSTTWSVLNGVTMNCVQCHAHPYDPIEHEEFYSFYSFLNTTQDSDKSNDVPHLKYAVDPTKRQQAFDIQEQLIQIKENIAYQAVKLNDQVDWEKLDIESGKIDELTALIKNRDYIQKQIDQADDKKSWKYGQWQLKVKRLNEDIAAIQDQPLAILGIKNGEVYETSEGLAASAIYKLKVNSQLKNISALQFLVAGLDPEIAPHTPEAGYKVNEIKVWHVKPDGSEQPISFAGIVVGNTEVLDGQLSKLFSLHKQREKQGLKPNQPLAEGDSMGSAIALSASHLFNPRWSVAVLAEPIALENGDYLKVDVHRLDQKVRHLAISATTNNDWLKLTADPDRLANINRYTELKPQLSNIASIDVPVMYQQDSWDQRGTALFGRGNFLAKEGELLEPATPKLFPAFEPDSSVDRLAMAKWFFKEDQPLTARVAVNRFWHTLFGRGIVETLEDFGSIGEKPSHPELLDWLAIQFQQDLQWDMKQLIRLLVTSHTYQQKSKITEQLQEQDPNNVWLARGPMQRLTAEMVRDQALLVSGLLTTKMHGKPVMPPQPDNVWGRKGVKIKDWKTAKGEDRYRRAVYTFIKRQYAYPSFETFDMESRELSHARRIPTNTPLQALVTLNDPVYHEAAQSLAELMLEVYKVSPSQNKQAAIRHGYQLVLSQMPDEDTLNILSEALDMAYAEVEQGDDKNAWTAVASILLNLDNALTR